MTKKHYCTGWRNAPANINSCCHQHDRDYGIRGTVTRADADKRLRECMIKNGNPIRAWLFWLVVRAFGWRFYKNKEIKIEK
ncbi:hypothetical protein Mh1949_12140 [Mannheimia haemolytica]|uniref:Uncharacterized protein n=1 Tax=Mannheimia phage vB_MhM_1152AP TaxID=1182515 RepID=R9QCM1_9CAUD|nr:hypothetical protein [Mannheimia haemolytica]AFL46470.1 hypothetical protein 1152AP_0022 [Mannheimia phage vB_MhM_1152AP]AGK02322.1 hypothetical protein MHH_c18740 [Mannheimia haemolytica M42548]AGQ24353.1 hypothetical protein F382_02130 [Mannheimia haemolytica D153]QEB06546.1 hypothetical protein BG603_02795 [Mannheimia haemolytica]QEB18061.1 hypothetical protein BG609_07780 [Mannheimia haemolytica]